ncbi:MAG: squalene/phytoene synthase family protein [Spirochaetales bacterium]|nr:squalene/phytoene synthase family protein [Spirochaetales bacterium]
MTGAAATLSNPDAIFERGSRTYYNASRFFPRALRERVTTLYAFVRSADDYVDATPQDAAGFMAFRECWNIAASGDASIGEASTGEANTGDAIVDRFAALAADAGFERAWVEAFLDAMQADLSVRAYDSIDDTLGYVYGSAEVIGLFMARLMELPPASYPAARALGRAMQYVNFVRDFAEDRALGRRYLPLEGASPAVACEAGARADEGAFNEFLRRHVDRYRAWAAEGRSGFGYIPRRYRVAIATAMDMYDWTAARVYERPLVVWERAVKPGKARIIADALLNAISGGQR